MRVSLAQATATRLGDTSCKNRGGFSGVFAQVRATHLGENTRLRTYSHMQKPRFFTQFQTHPIVQFKHQFNTQTRNPEPTEHMSIRILRKWLASLTF